MTRSIDRDLQRFKRIVRGKVRDNLRKYVTHGEMLGRKGREIVSIPVPNIEIPHFRHGQKGSGGVDRGRGKSASPSAGGRTTGTGRDRPVISRADTSARWKSPSKSWRTCWARCWNFPISSPRAKNAITSKKDRYTTIRQLGARFAPAFQAHLQTGLETPGLHEQLRSRKPGDHARPARTSAFAPGKRSPSPKPMPPSST